MVAVRLVRKLADIIDGIDLRNRRVGDVLYLSGGHARLLIAEGWAERMPEGQWPGYSEAVQTLASVMPDN